MNITSSEQSIESIKDKKKEERKKSLIGMIGLVAIIIVISVLAGNNGSKQNNTPPDEVKVDGGKAYIIAQNFVKIALKSPSTAKFPFGEYKAINTKANEWSVVSYVDAQNSFGAQIRTYWTATLTFLGTDWADTNNWRLEELTLGDETTYKREKKK